MGRRREPLRQCAVQVLSRDMWRIFHAGRTRPAQSRGHFMNNIIYIVGLIVVVLAILSFLGLR
jgi:small-conductance mechanosensitive channel